MLYFNLVFLVCHLLYIKLLILQPDFFFFLIHISHTRRNNGNSNENLNLDINMYLPSHTHPYLSAQLPGVSVDRVCCRKNLVTVSHVGVLLPAAFPQPTGVGWFRYLSAANKAWSVLRGTVNNTAWQWINFVCWKQTNLQKCLLMHSIFLWTIVAAHPFLYDG